MTTNRMSLIVAGSILLDSTFNTQLDNKYFLDSILYGFFYIKSILFSSLFRRIHTVNGMLIVFGGKISHLDFFVTWVIQSSRSTEDCVAIVTPYL
jgi:hypothetical protein